MAATAVEADPVVSPALPPERALPPSLAEAIGAAGFPAELGDATTFFRYARLDATSPTISHLLVNGGLSAYNRSGMAIQRAVMALNRAENPQWGMRNIRGEFIFVDAQRLAAAPEPVRAATMAALERLTRQLGGAVSGPIEGDTDQVDRTARPRPTGPRPAAVTPAEPGATPRGAPLPAHPALEGITDEYRAWLTRSDNRMRTVEALLGSRPESFEAGLTAAAARHDIREGGRHANIQQAAMALQTDLQVPGAPDGKFGRVSTPILEAARARYGGDRLATTEGRVAVRTELQGRDTLAAAVSDRFGADRVPEGEPPPEPRTVATVPVIEPRDRRPPVDTRPEPVVAAPPNPYQELATLRTANPTEYATRRTALVTSAQGNGPSMVRVFSEAAAVDRAVAADLATAWLDANSPSAFSGPEVLQNVRAFARLVAREPAGATLPPALNDRLGRILAPSSPTGPALFFSEPTGEDLAAVTVYESARVARAQNMDELLRDDRTRYATFMWASPDVVARAITTLSANNPSRAEKIGDAMADHLRGGGPVTTLDGRVNALYAIFQRLQGVPRQRVEKGIRDMGTFMGWNVGMGLADHLIRRVTDPR